MAVNKWLEKAKKVNLLRVQHMQINMDKKAKENIHKNTTFQTVTAVSWDN